MVCGRVLSGNYGHGSDEPADVSNGRLDVEAWETKGRIVGGLSQALGAPCQACGLQTLGQQMVHPLVGALVELYGARGQGRARGSRTSSDISEGLPPPRMVDSAAG